MKKLILIGCLLLVAGQIIHAQQSDFPKLTGPYLGQQPPGKIPLKFASGILHDKGGVMAITFSSDGRECFYTYRPPDGANRIMTTKEVKGHWVKPYIPDFIGKPTGDDFYFEPHITPNDSMLIYGSGISNTAIVRQKYALKTGTGWSDPQLLNLGIEFCMTVSVAANGNLYFTGGDGRIHFARYVSGQYLAPEQLGLMDNRIEVAHPYIAPDESYIIYDSYTNAGNSNLFVNFRNKSGGWSESIKLDSNINTNAHEMVPFVTRDGKHLFFTRFSDEISIYWVSTKFIEELRPKE